MSTQQISKDTVAPLFALFGTEGIKGAAEVAPEVEVKPLTCCWRLSFDGLILILVDGDDDETRTVDGGLVFLT